MAPAPVRIGREDLALLERASRYRSGGDEQNRWALLYRVMWRLHHGERDATHAADSDGRVLHQRRMRQREAHHMHAFLRFYRDATNADTADTRGPRAPWRRGFAWQGGLPRSGRVKGQLYRLVRAGHDVLDLGAEHFADRLGGTPSDRHPARRPGLDGQRLDYRTPCPPAWTARARAAQTAGEDSEHALWRTYFVSTSIRRGSIMGHDPHMRRALLASSQRRRPDPRTRGPAAPRGRRLAGGECRRAQGKTLPPARR
ncbi:DUF4130 domain-containing protein [Salinicola tamaricis]|uniref:DUF4130 domain-containing protein n=1 Tax=Salinicola tamaricis TaxID=1771309 RepID=UPI0013ECBEBB|nr:DUF4130 domain-containing protein [Salinicola tamaricis]